MSRVLAELASYYGSINIMWDRDVEDLSITVESKHYDLLLYVKGVPVVGGEHKRAGTPMPEDELRAKHAGANASLYGHLGYILLYASTGSIFQLSAIPVGGDHLVHIGGETAGRASSRGALTAAWVMGTCSRCSYLNDDTHSIIV
jgi:hypothetical protein